MPLELGHCQRACAAILRAEQVPDHACVLVPHDCKHVWRVGPDHRGAAVLGYRPSRGEGVLELAWQLLHGTSPLRESSKLLVSGHKQLVCTGNGALIINTCVELTCCAPWAAGTTCGISAPAEPSTATHPPTLACISTYMAATPTRSCRASTSVTRGV